MNAPFAQNTRPGRLETVLGQDVLVLTAFDGAERLNDLFDYSVECVASHSNIDFDALIGTHATVLIRSLKGGEEAFDGIVTEVSWTGPTEHGDGYRLRLQPWFFLASLRRNQRIFHNKNVVEILTELLSAYGDAGRIETRLTADYPELEYTVQYRESDMNFACRMMERHGISYHFEHISGGHLMVISDDASEHVSIGKRDFKAHSGHHQRNSGHIHHWTPARRITTGAIRLTDYNFKSPTAAMEVDKTGDAAHNQGSIESYDFPGDYLKIGRGKVVADLRTRAERGQAERYEARGDIVSLRSGRRMVLGGDQVPGGGEEYICLGVTHKFTANAYLSTSKTGTSDKEDSYIGSYLLMPEKAPMVPERKTPLAQVNGPQTGVVVGDGEIDCDEYGRILVHLHWDLDKSYTMRCRVSQNWASKGWGGMVIPRIGMEVVVEFLEGDPDKPLVTGCVYNGKNDVPYPLPAHKTKSVFRSDSHQSGGFNELTFEDATGAENISLHAQKDQTLKVLNNRMKRIDNNQVESVGRNKSIDVGQNHQEKIGGSMNLTVGGGGGLLGIVGALGGLMGSGAQEMMFGAGEVGNGGLSALLGGLVATSLGGESGSSPGISSFVGAGQHREVAGADQVAKGTALGASVGQIMPVSGVMNTFVEKAKSDTIGMARTEQIGLLKNTVVGQVQNTTVGKKQFTKVGEAQHAVIGKTKKTIVGEEYVIEVGKSKLVMKADGTVTLTGVRFNFEASGPVQVTGKVIDLN